MQHFRSGLTTLGAAAVLLSGCASSPGGYPGGGYGGYAEPWRQAGPAAGAPASPYQASGGSYQPPPAAYQPPATPRPPQSAPSAGEAAFRAALMRQRMQFGGIFGPTIRSGLSGGGGSGNSCGSYSDHAACQAYRNGDRWAADRLQNRRSTGAERAWYNR